MIFSVRKELILVALAGTVVVMGLGFIIPLFPIYVSQKGATNFQLGLIVSGFTIVSFWSNPSLADCRTASGASYLWWEGWPVTGSWPLWTSWPLAFPKFS